MEPLPDPLLGVPMITQLSGLADVHAHVEAEAAIVTIPLPPSVGSVAPGGAIEKVHGAGAAACVMVRVWPATVIVPLRSAPVFGATE